MKKSNRRMGIILIVFFLFGCSAIQRVKPVKSSGFLKLDIHPKSAIVYVNDTLYGEITSFRSQTLELLPGDKRVEIRAENYESERFDIAIQGGEEVTLTLHLVSKLELDPSQDPKGARDFLKRKNLRKTSLPLP